LVFLEALSQEFVATRRAKEKFLGGSSRRQTVKLAGLGEQGSGRVVTVTEIQPEEAVSQGIDDSVTE
jgi:hypothetical protein